MKMTTAAIHPHPAMSGAAGRSRKQHGGFTPLAKNLCHSETDPIVALRSAHSVAEVSIRKTQ